MVPTSDSGLYRRIERRAGMEEVGERIALIEGRIRHMDAALKPLAEDVRKMREQLESQRGFVRGFSAAFALLWSLLLGALYYIWKLS